MGKAIRGKIPSVIFYVILGAYVAASIVIGLLSDSGVQAGWRITNIVLRAVVGVGLIWVGVVFLRIAGGVEKGNVERTLLYLGGAAVLLFEATGLAVSVLRIVRASRPVVDIVFHSGLTAVSIPAVAIVVTLIISTYLIISRFQQIMTFALALALLAVCVIFVVIPLFSSSILLFVKLISIYFTLVSFVLTVGLMFTAIAFIRSPWQHYFMNLTAAFLLMGLIGLGDFFFYERGVRWVTARGIAFTAGLMLFIHAGYLRWRRRKR